MTTPHGISDLGIAYPKDVERYINDLRLYGGVFSAMGGNPDRKGVMALVDHLKMTAIYALSARLPAPRCQIAIEDTLDTLTLSVEEIDCYTGGLGGKSCFLMFCEEEGGMVKEIPSSGRPWEKGGEPAKNC